MHKLFIWLFYLHLEESAYRVLTDEAPDGGHIAGIPKIIKAYELHKDNAEVVASIVSLVMELAEYGKKRWRQIGIILHQLILNVIHFKY